MFVPLANTNYNYMYNILLPFKSTHSTTELGTQ